MPKLRLLGAALGALCCAPLHAADYSNAIFFGDSLTDAGSYAPALPPGTGRFTTNPGPVWSEVFGQRLGIVVTPGNQGGTNYAEGGARVSQLPGVPDTPPTNNATPVTTQVANYLASTGGQADPNALYSVWAGANDIFTIAPTAATDPAAAQAYLQTTTAQLATEVARLAATGARRIIVWNLPDIGATPFGQSQGAAGAAGLTQLSTGYNQLLGVGLAATGVPVVMLDSFGLLNEIVADPARYGFANASLPACGATPSLLCTEASFVAAGADQSFVFADGVHPTTAGHAVLASYAASVLAAPAQISQLAELPVRTQAALSQRLWQTAEIALSTRGDAANGTWASVEGGRTELGEDDGTPWGLAIGVDRRIGEDLIAGAALSFDRSEPDWDDGGSFDAEEVALSGYVGYRHGAMSITGHMTLASTDYETDRRVTLGTASRRLKGEPDGNRAALGIRAAYAMSAGAVHHGPLASVLLQEVSVQSFAETASDGSTSSTLTFGKQRRRATLLSVGWQAFLRAGAWTPYASVVLSHDAEADGRQVKMATSVSPSFVQFEAAPAADSYATAHLGVVGQLGDNLQLGLDLTSVVGNDDLSDTRLAASLRMPF
ncbi:MAG: autotransporter domain-containing protein [Rhodocyclaceae bacterium]|nr:autotransporter domain-containing protein [Rhodocyclaceae bacterium]